MPDKECFYSSIKDETTGDNGEKLDGHISDEDYFTSKKIWNKFEMKNKGDYHDRYLKKDVLLLAYVFEKFTEMCLQFYRLDPCHYFSSPGLSWDAIFNDWCKIRKNIWHWHVLIHWKRIKGRSFIHCLKIQWSKQQIHENYDPEIPSKLITYLDMNNLYDWAMSSYLP